MDIYYTLNYFILSIFFTLFMLEIGVALLSIVGYDEYKQRIRRYINPLWELEGTFAVFYLVNLVATYPTFLNVISYLYVVPLMVAAALFILRNAFIVYSEYTSKPEDEKKYMRIYGVSTLLIAFLLVSVLSSVISGGGVDLGSNSPDLLTLLFNPFNLSIFFALLLINLFLTSVYFNVEQVKRIDTLCLFVGVSLAFIAVNTFTGYIIANALRTLDALGVILFVLVSGLLLYRRRIWLSRYFIAFWFFLTVNFFARMQYPYIFGGAQAITDYMTNSAIGVSVLIVTIIGGLFLLVSLALFAYINYIKRGPAY